MFEEGKTYHLFNRGNNRDTLFYKDKNYHYFLWKFSYYVKDYLDIFCYCLLPNHFHFMVRVRTRRKKYSKLSDEEYALIISNQLRRFFITYSQAINKQEGRVGSLLQKSFKAKEIESDIHFNQLVFYIHANPQLHSYCSDFKKWRYSSYKPILNRKNGFIKFREVIQWFGGMKAFVKFHEQPVLLKQKIILEDC
jgi:REP element-mobilizing transposase RayT